MLLDEKLMDSVKERIFNSIDNIEYIDSIVSESISKNENVLSTEFDESIKMFASHIRADLITLLRMIGK